MKHPILSIFRNTKPGRQEDQKSKKTNLTFIFLFLKDITALKWDVRFANRSWGCSFLPCWYVTHGDEFYTDVMNYNLIKNNLLHACSVFSSVRDAKVFVSSREVNIHTRKSTPNRSKYTKGSASDIESKSSEEGEDIVKQSSQEKHGRWCGWTLKDGRMAEARKREKCPVPTVRRQPFPEQQKVGMESNAMSVGLASPVSFPLCFITQGILS